ncbi:GTPase HflX [Candidatus Bathyarchaeota archaeon]|nr:MAG: GTPase HflX [Candidatus Bathyarchaeota archaeon]
MDPGNFKVEFEVGMAGEKVILVERRLRGERSLLHELESLAETVGYRVVGKIEQVRPPDPKYQIGSGKAVELAKMVRELGVEKVIFENDLKPVQAYNLAKETGVEIIDKFQLILDVFSQHASTKEAKLQIELAKLRYELARAKEKVRLAKRGEQPGFHGLGKYEADVYYEAIRRRIAKIEKELQRIRESRKLKRFRRASLGIPTVSLSGYTAAGKSTLFKAFSGVEAKITGSLFTTLTTKIALTSFAGRKSLLIDTVGFIDGLPLTLIEAFKSTLEETIFSDLIILVVDCSEPLSEVKRKLSCSLSILREIGIRSTPIITALNKIDLVEAGKIGEIVEALRGLAPNPVPISALHGLNLEELEQAIASNLRDYVKASFELPLSRETLTLLSHIRRFSTVREQRFTEKAIYFEVESTDIFMDKLKGRVEKLGGRMLEAVKL